VYGQGSDASLSLSMIRYVARRRPISLASARRRANSAVWNAVVALTDVVSESSVSLRS
jgi:hypothetical protein